MSVLLRAAWLLQLGASAIDNVMASVLTTHPQIACRKYFEARYPGVSSDLVGNHPNTYFNEAYKALKSKLGPSSGQASASGSGATSAPVADASAAGEAAAASGSGEVFATPPAAAGPSSSE